MTQLTVILFIIILFIGLCVSFMLGYLTASKNNHITKVNIKLLKLRKVDLDVAIQYYKNLIRKGYDDTFNQKLNKFILSILIEKKIHNYNNQKEDYKNDK